MRRAFFLAYGFSVYLFFLATFLYMIGFIGDVPGLRTIDSGTAGDPWLALVVDVLLLSVFAVQHSVMARSGFKRWWTRIVPQPIERSTFVLAASLALVLVVWQWRPLPELVWSVDDEDARITLYVLSGLGWAVLLVATFLINHFELFGLQQVYDHWRGSSLQSPTFRTPALYRVVRHPIYLGFIVAFWATPYMTRGHLLFAGVATAYIFVGILFEERDLIAQFGDRYRRYREEVGMLLPRLGSGTARQPAALPRTTSRRPGSE